jgi:hypothetical protein
MQQQCDKSQIERRKHWRDRRACLDRRNPERIAHSGYDCRSDNPRRQSDIDGDLAEGDIWWNSDESYLV